MAGRHTTRTTRLYDLRTDAVALDEWTAWCFDLKWIVVGPAQWREFIWLPFW
jgi:hypothetical protein